VSSSSCRYKQALRSCPSCPAEVRLGIAACCLKLGNTQKADLAYRRTLELLPGCTPALLGLAVLKLHVSNDEEVRRGSTAMQHGLASPDAALRCPAAARDPPGTETNLALGLCLVGLQGIREGSQLLVQAFEQDAENPFVLLLLAHFCVRQGFADKVHTALPAHLWKQLGLCASCSPFGHQPAATLAVRCSRQQHWQCVAVASTTGGSWQPNGS